MQTTANTSEAEFLVSNTSVGFTLTDTSLGGLLVAASDCGVCYIALGDDPDSLLTACEQQFGDLHSRGRESELGRWAKHVTAMVENPRSTPVDTLPLDIRGSHFQQRVWQALRQIPAGETASYSDIALQIGTPLATRAVASACAANTLAVVIPCHRVVRKNGGLSGYRWGTARKRELLAREGVWLRAGAEPVHAA